MQTRYGYDAFGNRTWKEESGERTSYQYNVINQMVSEKHGELLKAYSYDKRGNLTGIQENGAWKKQYVYGAINRLEEAVDAAGKQARYQYNGLGHRVGKQENVLPKEKLEKLDPQNRIGMEIGNSRQIAYTLDLTRQYYNLLERTEESQSQRYFWDGNVAAYEENGERNYYLKDELGSPLRIEDSDGNLRESYGYGAFGEDLYQNQGKKQPFGYTGYQRDEIAGTYYAQAREYLAESGRFQERDIIKGQTSYPLTLNEYIYCGNMPFYYYDPNGLFWHIVCGAAVGIVANTVINVGTSLLSGEKITASQVISSIIGGAITGGITAATGNVMAGTVVGGAAERIIKGTMDGDSIQDIAQDVAVGTVVDVAIAKVGKYLTNTSMADSMKNYLKGTKWGNKIFKSDRYYRSQITRARNAWKNKKIIKPRFRTYMNGFLGVSGMELIDKVTDLQASYIPGMDIKEELRHILNDIYDNGEEWIKEANEMRNYTNQILDKMLKTITNEELETVLCIE